MPEFRQNMATKEWVIIATERAKRPEDFTSPARVIAERPSFVPTCPFCPSNEHLTEETLCEHLDGEGKWSVRVVPNKYPALVQDGPPVMRSDGAYRSMGGVGVHEVIIESAAHNLSPALYSVEHMTDILAIYRSRFRAMEREPDIAITILFKNHGETAGTSLEHPHSQLVGTPIVPTQVRHRLEAAMRWFDDTGECVFCRMAQEELARRERIITESARFAAFTLYASCSPFHIWILPKAHRGSFSQAADEELADLAAVLRDVLRRLYWGLSNPDYNFVIRVAPRDLKDTRYFHWYVAVIPRLTKAAGFELGSGIFINVSRPEEDARFLREVTLPAE